MKIHKRDHLLELYDKYHNFLTQTQKQAFQLHYIEDLSLAEISEIIVTTRSAIFDAVKKAEKKLLAIETKLL